MPKHPTGMTANHGDPLPVRNAPGPGPTGSLFRAAALALLLPMTNAGAADAGLEQQRRLFQEAEQALRQNQPDLARQKADALTGYPLETYLRAQILNREPLDEAGVRAYLETHGESRHAQPLRKKLLERLAARDAYTDFLRYYRDADASDEQRCRQLWALFQTGRGRDALAGAARMWDSGEPTPPACEPIMAAWQASPEFTAEHFWRRFAAALEDNRTALAAGLLSLAPAGKREQAETWLKLHGNPALAEQCLAWNSEDTVDGRIFAHAVARLAKDQPLRAEALWNLRRDQFRVPPAVAVGLDRRLALALANQRRPEASAYLAALPDAEADGQSRATRVRAALAIQDWPAALAALDRLDASEQQQPAWRYWRARALDELGDTAAATAGFQALAGERDFYGFLAADRVGRNYDLSFVLPAAPPAELDRLAATPGFRAIAEFRALQKPGEALREWAETLARLPLQDRPLAARLASGWAWHRQAIAALGKGAQNDHLALRFPLAYTEMVQREADKQGFDPALIFGVIRRESAFDPEAKSPVGASGLMQLMPGTGEEVARKLKENWTSARSLADPGRNIRYGSAYFRGLLDRFGGHPALAAAGYNAGPTRADRWQPKAGPLPADLWIEAIPFEETRQYVMAVLSYATLYRARLGHPAPIGDLLPDIPEGGKADAKPDRPVALLVCG